MKAILALAAAAAVAVTATPALAKKHKKVRAQQGYYAQSYAPSYAPYGYWGGVAAPVAGGWARGSDPSIGHPTATAISRATGKCVEDLGYGRFKYCGW
jgi:hypothetical protein